MDYREQDRLAKINIETIQTELAMHEPTFCNALAAKMNVKHLNQIEYSNALVNRAIEIAFQKFNNYEGRQHLADYLIQVSRAVREGHQEPVFSMAYHYEGFKETQTINRVIPLGNNCSVEVEL